MIGIIFGALLTAVTVAGSAYLGHRADIAHLHILGIVPLGALAIGAASSIGVVLAIRITQNYDTPSFRVLGQVAGVAGYCGAVVLDYLTYHVPAGLGPTTVPVGFGSYVVTLINQEAKALIAVLPSFMQMPPALNEWAGVVQILVEALVASIATGWMISFFAEVPFCVTNRRFYNLKTIMESRDLDGLREWERAINEHRPIEARSIFARARGAGRGDSRQWIRIVVHQCPVCLTSRVRIEPRSRVLGVVRTGTGRDLRLDSRGSAAVPD